MTDDGAIKDTQLWQDYLAGSQEALGAIAIRYYLPLQRYGRKFGVDEAVVEDCIQDLFLELWENRNRINVTASVKYYLFKSLRHAVMRYQSYHKRFTSDDDLDWELPETRYAETLVIEKEGLAQLAGFLSDGLAILSKREREALYLRYYEKVSVAEIADLMEVNRQSVSNFLQKAMSKLRGKWMSVYCM